MLKIQCLLCKAQTPTKLTELASLVIAKNDQEELYLLSQELAKHMEMSHRQDLTAIANTIPMWSTLMLLRHFEACPADNESDNRKVAMFEEEKENMRTQLAEALMLNAPEDEEIEELEDDELTEEEAEELEEGEEEEEEDDEEEEEFFEDEDEELDEEEIEE